MFFFPPLIKFHVFKVGDKKNDRSSTWLAPVTEDSNNSEVSHGSPSLLPSSLYYIYCISYSLSLPTSEIIAVSSLACVHLLSCPSFKKKTTFAYYIFRTNVYYALYLFYFFSTVVSLASSHDSTCNQLHSLVRMHVI